MKLLHIGKYLPPVPGGMETSVLQLCDGLSEAAHDVTCLVSNTSPNTVREKLGKVSVIRAARFGTLASTPLCPTFHREGLRVEAQLYHFHLPNPLATFSFGDFNRPYVVTYHCDIVRYPALLALYKPSMLKFLKRSKGIVVTSKELLETSNVLGEVADKCTVIPLGLATAHLEKNETRIKLADDLRRKWGNRIALFVGRLVPYKGLADLVSAMKSVDGSLIIVGQGPERALLQRQIAELNLGSKVHLAGYIPDETVGAYYQAAQVVALTSRNESEAFGMCLLEGLACGKPLLTTNLKTGVKSVNIDGVTGLHVPVGDVGAISKSLSRLLEDEALQKKLGEAGHRHFLTNYQRSAVVQAHVRFYEKALT
jgi:glycosyltransferase involved in cell wall biosynthesis